MTTRAYLYCRVSTDDQVDNYSLPAQERAGRLYCELHGYDLAAVYTDDGYSGTTDERPALQQLLATVTTGDVVLVHKLDRFFRNVALLLRVLEDFERRGVRFISVSEAIDFSSPIGKVILTILAAFSAYYVDNLRAETRKGHREKAARGEWVGPVPFGYKKLGRGTIVPSDDADTVRLIFELYTSGAYSFGTLADELNRRGLTAYDWQTRTRGPWGRENIRTILRNRAYMGEVSAGGQKHQGTHEALVTPEEWAAANGLRDERTHRRAAWPSKAGHGWLVGAARCARCGRKLWLKNSNPAAGSWAYHCPGRRAAGCEVVQSRAALVEAEVRALLDLVAAPLPAGGTLKAQREHLVKVLPCVWLDGGHLVALTPAEGYRALFKKLGWRLRDAE